MNLRPGWQNSSVQIRATSHCTYQANGFREQIRFYVYVIFWRLIRKMYDSNNIKSQLEYVRDHADEMTHKEIVAMIRDILQRAEKEENYASSESNA